jgi:hypothetical protein
MFELLEAEHISTAGGSAFSSYWRQHVFQLLETARVPGESTYSATDGGNSFFVGRSHVFHFLELGCVPGRGCQRVKRKTEGSKYRYLLELYCMYSCCRITCQ